MYRASGCCWGHMGNTGQLLAAPEVSSTGQTPFGFPLLCPRHRTAPGTVMSQGSSMSKWLADKQHNELKGAARWEKPWWMGIQRGSDIIALGVSELGFYSSEQHVLNITIIKQILESPTPIPYCEHIFYFFVCWNTCSPSAADSYMNWERFVLCKAKRVWAVMKASTETYPSIVGTLVAVNNALYLITRRDGCLMVSFNSTPHLCLESERDHHRIQLTSPVAELNRSDSQHFTAFFDLNLLLNFDYCYWITSNCKVGQTKMRNALVQHDCPSCYCFIQWLSVAPVLRSQYLHPPSSPHTHPRHSLHLPGLL